jgi:hypothetical protein
MIDPTNGIAQMNTSWSDFCNRVTIVERTSKIVAMTFNSTAKARVTEAIAVPIIETPSYLLADRERRN